MTPTPSVTDQALAMIREVEAGYPGALARLGMDSIGEISQWPEVQVQYLEQEREGSRCSVAGSYDFKTKPPSLAVARASSWRRQHFTVLHELGHHLQQTRVALAVSVRQQSDPVEFEDRACDEFAGRVLIDDTALAAALAGGRATAQTVRDLFDSTNASRAACCVRAVDYLGTTGFLAVLDDQGIITFAVRRGDIYPPARGSDQSGTPLVSRALESRRDITHDDTFIIYGSGSTSALLYGQASWSGDMLVVAAVLDRAPWKSFSVARPGTAIYGGPSKFVWCEVCQDSVEAAGETCPNCSGRRCLSGHCDCTTARERQCDTCYQMKAPNLYDPPSSTRCIDCY